VGACFFVLNLILLLPEFFGRELLGRCRNFFGKEIFAAQLRDSKNNKTKKERPGEKKRA